VDKSNGLKWRGFSYRREKTGEIKLTAIERKTLSKVITDSTVGFQAGPTRVGLVRVVGAKELAWLGDDRVKPSNIWPLIQLEKIAVKNFANFY
jgi:hypothetical protein